jgi:hypothetical protein
MAIISREASGLTSSPLENRHHVERRGDAHAVPLVLRLLAEVRPALRGSELGAVAADLAERPRGPHADAVQIRVDLVGRHPVEDHVGGGVVAEHDHEMDHVGQRQLNAGGQLGPNHAGPAQLVRLAHRQRLGPLDLAAAHGIENRRHDGQFDGAGRAYGSGFADPHRRARIQVPGVERNRARKAGDARAQVRLERLRPCGSGEGEQPCEVAHEIDDNGVRARAACRRHARVSRW